MKTEVLLAAGGAVAWMLWGARPVSAGILAPIETPTSPTTLGLGPTVMPPTTLEVQRTITGEVVPFWNGTGIQLGNGSMILPDGRVVLANGTTLVTRLRPVDPTPWRPQPPDAPEADPTRAIIKTALKTVLNPRLLVKAADLAGFTNAPAAVSTGVASGDVIATTALSEGGGALSGIGSVNIAVVGAVIGAAISIGFTLASEMPSDMMAVSVALDVLNLALAFIPVVGWALALVASMFKSTIVAAFAPDLTHEQREMMELSRVLEKTRPMYDYWVRRAVTPTQLYEGIATYNRGDLSHEQLDGVAIDLRYLSVDGRVKIIRPTGPTPRSDGAVLHGGGWVTPGTPQDFVTSVALIPEGLSVRIQAGIALEKLAPAEDYHAMQIHRRCRMILEAQHAGAQSLKVLTHIWHMTRDPVINVPRWLNGTRINPLIPEAIRPWETTLHREVPLLEEVILSLYYNDLALMWDVTRMHSDGTIIGDWQALVGVVIQPRWTIYHRSMLQHGSEPTLGGFLAWLGEPDIMTLRYHVFAGVYPVEGTTGVAMFEQIANDLKVLTTNLDVAWRRTCLGEPYPYPDPDFQGLYRGGKVSTAIIQEHYRALTEKATGLITEITPAGEVVTYGITATPDLGSGGWGTG